MDFIDRLILWWNGISSYFETNGVDILVRTVGAFLLLIGGHYLLILLKKILRGIFRVNKNRVDQSVTSFLISVFDIFLRFALVVAVLLVLRVDLTGLATIISSGILAIGFAMQDIIGNFAAGVILLGTKPFLTGNYIEIDGVGGTVREVRMMSTVLVTANGQNIFVPNKVLTSNKVTNFSVEPFRRAVIKLSFSYDIDFDKVQALIFSYLNNLAETKGNPTPRIEIDGFTELGYSVSVFYHAKTTEYWTDLFMINKEITKRLMETKLTPATRSKI